MPQITSLSDRCSETVCQIASSKCAVVHHGCAFSRGCGVFSWANPVMSTLRGISFRSASTLPAVWALFSLVPGSSRKGFGIERWSSTVGLDVSTCCPSPSAQLQDSLWTTVSMEGLATRLGFGTLAVLWFAAAVQAYRNALKGEIDLHRRWMIRNFALTLAAVTLRNWLPLMLFALHWPFRASYITVSWVCWVPNLLVAEWMMRRNPS